MFIIHLSFVSFIDTLINITSIDKNQFFLVLDKKKWTILFFKFGSIVETKNRVDHFFIIFILEILGM